MALQRLGLLGAIFLGLALIQAGPASAQAKSAKAPKFDRQSAAVLKAMSDYLGSQKTFALVGHTMFEIVEKGGIKITNGMKQRLVVRRPDRLLAVSHAENKVVRKFWYDGKTFTYLNETNKEWDAIRFTGPMAKLFDRLSQTYGVNFPVVDFMSQNPYAGLSQGLISGVYVGEKVIDGVLVHHLSFESQGSDWQIWVRKDGPPVPVRLVVHYVGVKGTPSYVVTFTKWEFNLPTRDESFVFQAPAGTSRKDIFAKMKATQK